MNDGYESYFRKKAEMEQLKEAQIKAANGPKVEDLSGGIPESDFGGGGASAMSSAGQAVGGQMAQAGASSGSLGQTAGGALMMTGNPYLMGAGLGLSVLSAGEQNKRKQEEAQRLDYNARIAERQKMMLNIAEMGIK